MQNNWLGIFSAEICGNQPRTFWRDLEILKTRIKALVSEAGPAAGTRSPGRVCGPVFDNSPVNVSCLSEKSKLMKILNVIVTSSSNFIFLWFFIRKLRISEIRFWSILALIFVKYEFITNAILWKFVFQRVSKIVPAFNLWLLTLTEPVARTKNGCPIFPIRGLDTHLQILNTYVQDWNG